MTIFLPYTVIYPWAMMIIGCYTFLTFMAMSCSIGLVNHADTAITAISFLINFFLTYAHF
jgi:hypothetical protein